MEGKFLMRSEIYLRSLKISLLMAAIVFMVVAGSPCAAGQKYAVVDVELILKRSVSIQSAIEKADQKVGKKEQLLEEKMDEYQRLRSRLKNRESVMRGKDIKEEQARLEERLEEMNDLQYEINKEMARIEREILDPEVKRIEEAVKAVGRDESYSLIVRNESVLFYNPEIDITSTIIRELDREFLGENDKDRPSK